MPTHELYTNKNGTVSLRELRSGEVMHSSVGPREEATLLYIDQSRLRERLRGSADSELVVWDVGLGAGTNALAALQCQRETAATEPVQRLRLVSFENDVSGLRLSLEHREQFPFFSGFETAAAHLLEHKCWSSRDGRDGGAGLVHWELREGQFRDRAACAPKPDLIFFDFYSPKSAPELWDVATFRLIHDACHVSASDTGTTLFTYSASTRVRVALLVAGFFVGYGRSTGAKLDTTVAATRLRDLERPLDARWLERLHRSHNPLPFGWPPERRAALFELVRDHPQFQNSAPRREARHKF